MARRGWDDAQVRRVQAWIDGYVRAWSSNDPADIRALFTQDAAYACEPYSRPWRGQDEIVRQWQDHKDEPGQVQFRWHPLAVTSEVAVIQGEIAYPSEGHTSSNLLVIRLDAEGRCAEFTEWWMRHLLSPQTNRRPARKLRLPAIGERWRRGLPGRHGRDQASLEEDGSDERRGVGRDARHGGAPCRGSALPCQHSRRVRRMGWEG